MTLDLDALERLLAEVEPGPIENVWVNDDRELARLNFGETLRHFAPELIKEVCQRLLWRK